MAESGHVFNLSLVTRFSSPPIPHDSMYPEDFMVSKLMRDYAERNVTLRLENNYIHWVVGKGSRFFTINARLVLVFQE